MGAMAPREDARWRWRWLGPPSVAGTWVGEVFRRGVSRVLRAGGPIPRHVAIVMDGNRRFAQSRNMDRERGHKFGADKLLDVLEWCLGLGVECLSVYAFSTENFKRTQTEIDTLFALAEEKLEALATSEVIKTRRVRVQVLGELHTLPPGVQQAAARATAATWHHGGPVLNVCFAYTGREDIAQAVGALGAGVASGELDRDAVTEAAVERFLHGRAFDAMSGMGLDGPGTKRVEAGEWKRHGNGGLEGDGGVGKGSGGRLVAGTQGSMPVDLLVRTSGETRLSDFILWGTAQHAVLCFLDVLWPDFSFTDMCYTVWQYQRSAAHSLACRSRYEEAREASAAGASSTRHDVDEVGVTGARGRPATRGSGEAECAQQMTARKRRHVYGPGDDGEAEASGGMTVAWVNVPGGEGDDGGTEALLTNHNRRKLEEMLRMATMTND